MKYIKLVIAIDDEYQEMVITELLELDFDAFEQQDDQIIIFMPQKSFNDEHRQRIEQILAAYPSDNFIKSEEVIADQNWNEQWESTIKAQQIGSFFVRPTWSGDEAPENAIVLKIDPKMAFGTGYHETTRLMLRLLPDVVQEGDRVMDAGTGTGILAIAAAKLGARTVFALDIDEWSITNSRENISVNNVSDNITIKRGSIEVVGKNELFDTILANIQRNPIIELMPSFKKHLKKSGVLLFSGLLESDQKVIEEALAKHHFKVGGIIKENKWIAIKVTNSL